MNWRDPKHPQAGGAETYLFEMARRWVAGGHTVVWLTTGFRGAPKRETIDGVSVRRVGNPVTIYALIPLYYVLRMRGRFDAVVDSENGIPFYSPLYAGVPQICVMHHVHKRVFEENLPFPISAFFVWLELAIMPLVYRRARFVAVSETTRDEMHRYRLSRRDVPIVYNGVDAGLVPGAKAAVPTIAYLGRLKKYKRIDVLVRAMPAILARLPSARLVIAGDGDQRDELARLASKLDVSSSVEMMGFIDEATKAEVLASTWVFASASSMEGWGISVIEANASGTVAVVADSPGLSVAVDDGVTGIVAPPDEIGASILDLLEDRERRERLAAAALERSKQFSWERAATAMLEIIYEEIDGARRTRPLSAAATIPKS